MLALTRRAGRRRWRHRSRSARQAGGGGGQRGHDTQAEGRVSTSHTGTPPGNHSDGGSRGANGRPLPPRQPSRCAHREGKAARYPAKRPPPGPGPAAPPRPAGPAVAWVKWIPEARRRPPPLSSLRPLGGARRPGRGGGGWGLHCAGALGRQGRCEAGNGGGRCA